MQAYLVLLLLVAVYLAWREGRWISVSAMTLFALLVLYGGGHLYYYKSAGLEDRVADRVTVALAWMWLGLIAGLEVIRVVFASASFRREQLLRRWRNVPFVLSAGDAALWKLLALLMVAYLSAMFVLLGKGPQMLAFLSLDSELAKRDFRLAVGTQGGYFLRLVLAVVAPMAALYMVATAAVARRRLDISLAAALCVLVALFKIGSFHKAQWVWFLVQLLLCLRLVYSPRANLPWLLGGAVLFVAALLVGAQFAYPELDVVGLWSFLTYRIFEINNEGLYQFLYVYPEYIPHTHGMNVGLLHALFGDGEFVPAHTRVAQFFGSFDATNNAVFVADAWVDFAYAGVFVVSLAVGMIVKSVDLIAAQLGRTPAAVALVAFSFYGVITLSSTSAFTALLTGGLVSAPLLVLAMRAGYRWVAAEIRARRTEAPALVQSQ